MCVCFFLIAYLDYFITDSLIIVLLIWFTYLFIPLITSIIFDKWFFLFFSFMKHFGHFSLIHRKLTFYSITSFIRFSFVHFFIHWKFLWFFIHLLIFWLIKKNDFSYILVHTLITLFIHQKLFIILHSFVHPLITSSLFIYYFSHDYSIVSSVHQWLCFFKNFPNSSITFVLVCFVLSFFNSLKTCVFFHLFISKYSFNFYLGIKKKSLILLLFILLFILWLTQWIIWRQMNKFNKS